MKYNKLISLFLLLSLFLSSCSLPFEMPSEGVWYNEELDISLEFETEPNSDYTEIVNITWNSEKDIVYTHIGYGREFMLYYINENGAETYILVGHLKYSNDKFVVTTSELVQPFDISGELCEIKKEFVFQRIDI